MCCFSFSIEMQGHCIPALDGGERRQLTNLQSRLLLANPAVLAQTHMAAGMSTACPIKRRPDVATY